MAFNINAHVILQGPKNISAVTKNIQTQLQGINVNVGVKIPKNVQSQIALINKQLNQLNQSNQKLTSSSNAASTSVRNIGNSAKQSANAMQVLGKETALTFKRFAAAGIVTATFFKLSSAIAEAVPKALEFERGLVRLQQITGSTRKGLDSLKSSVNSLAKSFGKDANELLELSQIFAQTGQSLKQVEASVRAVARSSLAPTFGEMKQTAEGLVAALNQFGIAASDSEKVLGSLNRVSKKFAVESDDLIAAIRRAGGVFAMSAGQFKEPITALNEFNAIFTAVRSTTRENAETIATGLRTIFSRIQRRGTIDMLQQLGINLTDAKGKFIGLFESFKRLSSGLKGLVQEGDAITLSKITEELGGIRQIGKLLPAIKNFNKAEAAFKEAQRGATEGLGKDVAKGLTPLIVQFERVRERFNALIRTISDSATFRAMAKTAVGLANAFLGVAESLTPILPILAKIAAIKLTKGAFSFFQGFFGSTKGMGAGGLGARAGGVVAGKPTGGGGGAGASAIKQAAQAMKTAVGLLDKSMRLNTTAIGNLNTTINTKLISSIGTLTNTIRSRGMGGGGIPIRGRGPRGFNTGGLVPGTGNYDTVPAKLTPGEFVMRKSAVKSIGHSNLKNMNRAPKGYQEGGVVRVNPKQIGAFALRPPTGVESLGKITGSARITNPVVTREIKDAAKNRALSTKALRGKRDKDLTRAFLTASNSDQARMLGFPDDIAKKGITARKKYAAVPNSGIDMDDLQRIGFGGKPAGRGILDSKGNILPGKQADFDKIQKRVAKTKSSYKDHRTGQRIRKSGRRHMGRAGLFAGLSNLEQRRGTGVEPAQAGELAQFTGNYTVFTPSRIELERSQQVDQLASSIGSKKLNEGITEFAHQVRPLINPGGKLGDFPNPTQSKSAIANLISPTSAAVDSISGFMNEGIIGALTGAKIAGGGANFDFPSLTGQVRQALQNLFDPNGDDLLGMLKGDGKLSGETKSTVNAPGSIARKMLNDINRGDTRGATFTGFAKGGGVFGSGSTDAMLTPGEYVFDKKSAQGIGYGNLNRMNAYGAGGVVTSGRNFYGKVGAGRLQGSYTNIYQRAIAGGASDRAAAIEANKWLRAQPGAKGVLKPATAAKAARQKILTKGLPRSLSAASLTADDFLKGSGGKSTPASAAGARSTPLPRHGPAASGPTRQTGSTFNPNKQRKVNLGGASHFGRGNVRAEVFSDSSMGRRRRGGALLRVRDPDARTRQTVQRGNQIRPGQRGAVAPLAAFNRARHTNLAQGSGVGITPNRQRRPAGDNTPIKGWNHIDNRTPQDLGGTPKAVNPLNAAIARDSANHPGRNVQANASNRAVQRGPGGKLIFTGHGSGYPGTGPARGIPKPGSMLPNPTAPMAVPVKPGKTPKAKTPATPRTRQRGGSGRGAGGGGMGGMGGMKGMGFAMIAMELMMTGPMLIDAMSSTAEGVEEKGQMMTQALMGLGTSLMFAAPMFMGGGGNKKKLGRNRGGLGSLMGMRGGPRMDSSRRAFSAGVTRSARGGSGKFGQLAGGLRGAGGGSMARGLGGTGLGMAALGPAIGGAVAVALSGPISEMVSGVGKLETVGKAQLKGSRAETQEGAAQRGSTKGMIAGGGAGAALGFIMGGPVGAAIGAAAGGIGGAFIGEMEGLSNKIKFDAVAQLNDSAKDASEALLALAKDAFVSKEDIEKANRETSEFINMMSLGSSSFDQADSESMFGREQGASNARLFEATIGKANPWFAITDFFDSSNLEGLSDGAEIAQRAGSRTKTSDFIERSTGLNELFGKGEKSKAEVQQDISAGKIVMEGEGFAEVLKEFDPKLAEQSSARVRKCDDLYHRYHYKGLGRLSSHNSKAAVKHWSDRLHRPQKGITGNPRVYNSA